MHEVAWLEINRKDEIVSKRKVFKTEVAAQKFVEKLAEKDNFYQILGYRK